MHNEKTVIVLTAGNLFCRSIISKQGGQANVIES